MRKRIMKGSHIFKNSEYVSEFWLCVGYQSKPSGTRETMALPSDNSQSAWTGPSTVGAT